MADNATVLPPLKAVTDTDHGGILAITASLGLVFGVISLLIRTYVRIECRASFGKDDYAAFLSMVFALIQGVLVFLAISHGFGKILSDLSPEAIFAWQRNLYVSDIFFLIAMWLTKSSVALLLMRLSRDPLHSVMARALLAASTMYFVVSIFVVSIRCDVSQPWNEAVAGCSTSTVSNWLSFIFIGVCVETYDNRSTPAGLPSPSWTYSPRQQFLSAAFGSFVASSCHGAKSLLSLSLTAYVCPTS